MYFKCHLAAEGEVVADRHQLSLSEMAALRKTHFLSPYTPQKAQLEYYSRKIDEYRRGEEACKGGEREEEKRYMRVDNRGCTLIFSLNSVTVQMRNQRLKRGQKGSWEVQKQDNLVQQCLDIVYCYSMEIRTSDIRRGREKRKSCMDGGGEDRSTRGADTSISAGACSCEHSMLWEDQKHLYCR